MPAQVGRDDVEAGRPALLGEPAEALAVAGDAVQADERRRARVAPLVGVEPHQEVAGRRRIAARLDNPRVEIEVRAGDIAAVEADAIANAANDALWMGAGVAGALKRAGGEEIEREALALGPIALGSAVATTAGRLRARYVLHGAVMGQDLRTSAELVRRTTHACLRLADELGCETLALPAFGTGVGGFPLDECARLMVAEARAFAGVALRRVIFAVYGDEARRAFERAAA